MKLRGYERLAAFALAAVLLWVPGRDREPNLQHVLAGIATTMPIATAVRSSNPAGQVWTLTTDPGHHQRWHDLTSDCGPHAAINPTGTSTTTDTPRTSSKERLLVHAQRRSR